MKKNGVFLFGIMFFVVEIFTLLYYANDARQVAGANTCFNISRIFSIECCVVFVEPPMTSSLPYLRTTKK